MYSPLIEFLKTLPPILWVGVAAAALWVFHRPIASALPRVTDVEALGVKMSLASVSIASRAVEQAVELAEKNGRFTVAVPAEARRAVLARAQAQAELLSGAEILWVDDLPGNNRNEWRMFNVLGAFVTCASSTQEAIEVWESSRLEGQRRFDIIISDMKRGDDANAGLELLAKLQTRAAGLSVIFYIGRVDPTLGTPAQAFAITDRPDELLQYVLDALARRRPGTMTEEVTSHV